MGSFTLEQWTRDFNSTTSGSDSDRRLYEAGLNVAPRLAEIANQSRALTFQDLDLERIVRAHCAWANRAGLLVRQMRLVSDSGTGPQFMEQMIQARYSSATTPIPSHPADLLEGVVDGLKYALDSVFGFEREHRPYESDLEVLRSVIVHGNLGLLFHSLVQLWGECLWNDWILDTSGEGDVASPPASEKERVRAVSRYRLQALQAQVLPGLRVWLSSLTPEDRRRGERTRLIRIDGSGKGRSLRFGKLPIDSGVGLYAAAARAYMGELYFAEFLDITLPKTDGLTLELLLDAWEALACASEVLIGRLPDDTEVRSVGRLLEYAPTLSSREVEDVLVRSLGCDSQVAKQMVSFFTRGVKAPSDIWLRPLLMLSADRVLPVVFALRIPNLMRSIESWAREGGLDLSIRGPRFETYVRQELTTAIGRSPCRSISGIHRNRFVLSLPQRQPEEIDLLLWVGHTVLVGEAKCIMYPASAYEDHLYYQTLERAGRQIRRKASLLAEHKEDAVARLDRPDGWDAGQVKVVPFVLVNSPFGVGLTIEGVPVIDLRILRAYFSPGSMKHFVEVDAQGTQQKGYEETFYSTPSEAEQHVAGYLDQPPQLRSYAQHLLLEPFQYPKLTEQERGLVQMFLQVKLPIPGARYYVSGPGSD